MTRFASQHRLLVLFTLMALAIRAVVPAGFMLDQGSNGETIISLCSGDGSRDVYYDAATDTIRELSDWAHDKRNGNHEAQACPFSSLLHVAVATSALPASFPGFPQSAGRFALPGSHTTTSRSFPGGAAPRAPPFKSFL